MSDLKPTSIKSLGEFLLVGDKNWKDHGKIQLFRDDKFLGEHSNKNFFSVGEYIWMGTDSALDSPD